jgi:hypothetical protein
MARRFAAGAALVFLAAVVPGVGAAAVPAGSAGRMPDAAAIEQLQDRALASLDVPAAVMNAATLAAGRMAPSSTGTARAGAVSLDSGLMPAGDFTRDGVRDVLDVRYQSVGSAAERLAIFARNGANGKPLWHKTVPGATGHLVLPLPERVGSGAPGVVLADVGLTTKSRVLTASLRLTALGRHGNTVWSHFESGTLDGTTNADHHLPLLVDASPLASTVTPDLLIARLDAPGGQDSTVTLTPVRVRGSNGSVVSLGGPVTSPVGAPSLVDVPDLSGDGFADIVLVVPGTGDGTGVYARHGLDGTPVWTSTSLTLNVGATATSVADVHASASGVPAADDIAVSSGAPSGGGLGLPIPVPDPTAPPAHGTVSLLDGATGSTVWTNTGDSAYAVHLAGSPLVPATGVVQTDVSSDSTTTTATVTLTTYDDTGKAIYAATYTAKTPTSSDDTSGALALVAPVGDFEPDGSIDGVVLVVVSSGSNSGGTLDYFRGVDGSTVDTGAAQPLGASTTGSGDDLFITTAKPRTGIVATVLQATDNNVLFSRSIPKSTGLSTADAFGAALHRSRCADVLVTGQGRDKAASAVLSGVGGLDWVVRFDPGSTSPGTVYRPGAVAKQPAC